MLRNRSFTVVVALALLGVVTLIFGTAIGTTPAAPSGNGVAAAVKVQPLGYAELKEAQLEQRDAEQFGSSNAAVTGEEESDRAMQQEQRALQKELRASASSWLYHYDSLTIKWHAYHYSMTPTGPVIDEMYEYPGKSGGAVTGCGLDRTEPDC